jgi:ABC-type molybdate transport system substrate-binding protein
VLKRMRPVGAAVMLVATLLLGACTPGNNLASWGVGGSQGSQSTNDVQARGGIIIETVPELQPALQALMPAWQQAYSDIPVVINTGPAFTLGTNQNTDVSADLLVTDSLQAQQEAVTQGLVENRGEVFAATTLDFVTPASNPGHIATLQDVATSGLRLVAVDWTSGVAHVTQAALERMMRAPEFTPDNVPCRSNYAACVLGNIALTVPDGLSATRLLATDASLDGAFVYHVNYTGSARSQGTGALLALPIPTNYAPPVGMWCAVSTLQAGNKANARLFQQFLLSDQAQAVLAAYGFLPPDAAANG